jgi:hypothetical protein
MAVHDGTHAEYDAMVAAISGSSDGLEARFPSVTEATYRFCLFNALWKFHVPLKKGCDTGIAGIVRLTKMGTLPS